MGIAALHERLVSIEQQLDALSRRLGVIEARLSLPVPTPDGRPRRAPRHFTLERRQ
jgi:hypothetical protein